MTSRVLRKSAGRGANGPAGRAREEGSRHGGRSVDLELFCEPHRGTPPNSTALLHSSGTTHVPAVQWFPPVLLLSPTGRGAWPVLRPISGFLFRDTPRHATCHLRTYCLPPLLDFWGPYEGFSNGPGSCHPLDLTLHALHQPSTTLHDSNGTNYLCF